MHIPSKKQPLKSGNWIRIDYDVNDFTTYNPNDSSYSVNTYSLSLKPTGDFNFNSINDWRWEGTWIEKQEEENKEIYVTCRKGSDSDITFSEDFPYNFKEEAEREIRRILKRYN
jgi:hypothetical protein